MDLSCDITKGQNEQSENLNPRAREFTPKRAAAVNKRIKGMFKEESTVEEGKWTKSSRTFEP